MAQFPELEDSLRDILKFVREVDQALEDGAQVTDLLVVWNNQANLKEIYADRKELLSDATKFLYASQADRQSVIDLFIKEFELRNEEAEDAVEEAVQLVNEIIGAFFLAKGLATRVSAFVKRFGTE